ncbi:S8 family peptidase [Geothrix limicola]|uniref:S8 family peptidase n=1 Tax=Geothrix limicola TaxID=2927978 RepID=UPI0025561419|nr:S8 family serine peptidase [Geothrix limicola]
MSIPKIQHLTAFATSLALALVLGCAPKSDATQTTSSSATPVTVNPASQYQFLTPASENDLKQNSVYGYLIAKAGPGFNPATFEHMGLSIQGKISLNGFDYYHLYKDSNVLETLQMLQANPGVLFAEADLPVKADSGITLNNLDPRAVSEEYSIYLTKTVDAWKTYGFGPNTPTVVDIDTGINWAHEDFQKGSTGIVQHAYSWYDLANGNKPIVPTTTYAIDPIDYIGTATTNTDDEAHGSHTAGTIAAQGNNGKGVAGVCWNTNLVSYKGLLNGSGSTWAIYGSLYHLLRWKTTTAYNHTIPVNMSLGGSGASAFAIEVVEACTSNNIVIIASMGNSGQNQANYPAAYQGVIAVGATNGQDKKVHFSTSGSHISVTAPGFDIISCGNQGPDDYESMSGTSMSAPFVTGLVSYMLTWNPDLTPAQIRTYLEKNADFIEGATGFTETNGWGRVNTLKTIGAVVADVTAKTAPASNYLNTPLRVNVQNTFNGTTTPLTNTPVYLYQSDPEGRITNFVASSVTSGDTDSLLAPAGSVDFNLLRPGTYVARCNVSGIQAYSPLITVTSASTNPTVTVPFKASVYNIQTLPDAAASSQTTTDDIVNVYDFNSAKLLTSVDLGALDTAKVMTAPNQVLMINLKPYQTYIGEYALWVGTSLYATNPAPGTFASPAAGGFAGSASHSSAAPQNITVNTLYNGNLTAASDWYKVTVP